MASVSHRSFRAALVACAPSLARIHERIAEALGGPFAGYTGPYGEPGGGCLPPPDFTGDSLASHGTNFNASITDFAIKYFSSQVFSKLDDGKPSKKKEEATWERFIEAEHSCLNSNRRLRTWADSANAPAISLARRYVRRVLREFSWDEAAENFSWGKGASTRLNRRKADAAHKYSGNPETTIGNAILANAALQHNPLWARYVEPLPEELGVGRCKIVPGNRIVTVPKNYKTHRTIAIEPDMNMYIQLGIGKLIRRRLKQAGLDLNTQTVNQNLACEGSATGLLATIDLSLASDTISRALVELLVPSEWCEALGQTRSPYGVLPSGEKIFYQKFSSMGNGYTFELETLIFWCLCRAVADIHGADSRRVTAYGDDLVVPVEVAEHTMGLLRYLGFTPNADKSYWYGPFRESCGSHFFLGMDVTPFYVKKPPRTLIDLFKIHNQIFRLEQRWATWADSGLIFRLQGVRAWLRSYAPAKWRKAMLLPTFGDGAFIGHFDEVTPAKCGRGWDGYRCKAIVTLPKEDRTLESTGLLVKSLSLIEKGSRRPRCLFTDPEESMVFPVVGTRYVAGEVFVPTNQLSRQCTCSSCAAWVPKPSSGFLPLIENEEV